MWEPKRINLGCGFDKRAGYLNVDLHDFHNPDLVADVAHLPTIGANEFDEALAQDVLEHLPREKAYQALGEWARILRPLGTLTLRVPGMIELAKLLLQGPHTLDRHRELLGLFYGTQAYDGDFHRCGFTAPVLVAWGRAHGLEVRHARIIDEWMFELNLVKADRSQLDDTAIVHNAYFEYAQRPADPGGLAFWTKELRDGRVTRAQLGDVLKVGD